jgi:hypothetical protein
MQHVMVQPLTPTPTPNPNSCPQIPNSPTPTLVLRSSLQITRAARRHTCIAFMARCRHWPANARWTRCADPIRKGISWGYHGQSHTYTKRSYANMGTVTHIHEATLRWEQRHKYSHANICHNWGHYRHISHMHIGISYAIQKQLHTRSKSYHSVINQRERIRYSPHQQVDVNSRGMLPPIHLLHASLLSPHNHHAADHPFGTNLASVL